MANTIEITPTEIGLKVGEKLSVTVNTTAENFTFANDNDSVVSVTKKNSKLTFEGLLKGAANVIVSADDAEDVRLVISVLESTESGTIYFHSNGGKGSMNPQAIALNETYSLPECTFEAPEGKVFIGWSEDSKGDSGIKNVNDLVQFHQDGEHTFFAIYGEAPEVVEPDQPEVDPQPEPEQPKEEEKPVQPVELDDATIASLIANLNNDWDKSIAEILASSPSKYKSIISKLIAYETKYGAKSLERYVPREQAGAVYDLYVNIVSALEWAKNDDVKFKNITDIVTVFFINYSDIPFNYQLLTKELSFWANAAFKPQATDKACWEELVEFFSGTGILDVTRLNLSNEVKEKLYGQSAGDASN